MKQSFILLTLLLALFASCKKDEEKALLTRNVVVVVIDGPRYTETWAHPTMELIPHRTALAKTGFRCDHFRNEGETYTVQGHTAIVTGHYQSIANNGSQYPAMPSLFQYWGQTGGQASLIASKDKLEVLSDCMDPDWKGLYRPATDCGNAGLGTGYREDSITFARAMEAITTQHPRLLMICLKEPDSRGHAGDSLGYIEAIRKTDEYVGLLWEALQAQPEYSNSTALLVTNDHGRHDHDFTSHGDNCEGCRHIEFMAVGPDFVQGHVCTKPHDLTDIAPTVAELLGIKPAGLPGTAIGELY